MAIGSLNQVYSSIYTSLYKIFAGLGGLEAFRAGWLEALNLGVASCRSTALYLASLASLKLRGLLGLKLASLANLARLGLILIAILSPKLALAADSGYRIQILDAATVNSDIVTLGDIATTYGEIPPDLWEKLKNIKLWPAPTEEGKPLQITRNRLSQALRTSLGEYADHCLLPSSLAIQRGGVVLRDADLRSLVVKELTPLLGNLSGQAELSDYRLPAYAFLSHSGQSLTLEPVKLTPGRISLRFVVLEMDGNPVRKFTGTVLLDLWAEVACAATPLNRGDYLGPDQTTWVRKNLTQLRGELWDGRGGPWQVQRAIGTGQPIYLSDIVPLNIVRKGDILNLVYKQGAIQLTVQAEALADGGPGTTIAVRNLQSKKQIYAVIKDANTVEVK